MEKRLQLRLLAGGFVRSSFYELERLLMPRCDSTVAHNLNAKGGQVNLATGICLSSTLWCMKGKREEEVRRGARCVWEILLPHCVSGEISQGLAGWRGDRNYPRDSDRDCGVISN